MKIDNLSIGIDFKRCSECEYKNNDIREELLVIAGARAAYMHDADLIIFPGGVDREHKLACDIRKMVDTYLSGHDNMDINFDTYIEIALVQRYGNKN